MNHVEGTGLGMPISKKIIEQHNSELVLKSKVGSGSCFSFRLPIADN
jgi:signal transduction histidine kinase